MEVLISGDNWTDRARMARGFRDRLTGLRKSSIGDSILIPTRSVHGFGMRWPIMAVGIDADLRVIGAKLLRPRRVVVFPKARYILEVPVGEPVPPGGSIVHIEVCDD